MFFLMCRTAFAGVSGFTSEFVELNPSSIVEGEQIEISVEFLNNEEKTLTGKINFYNKNELLGSRELNLAAGQSGEFIIEWEASLGSHEFTARAENLKLSGSSVSILGPSTEKKNITVGFKNSNIATQLREKGGFGTVLAGVWEASVNFFTPMIQTLDTWRISQIEPLETNQSRIQKDKENLKEEKVKPLLVLHSVAIFVALLVVKTKIVFFVFVVAIIVFVLIRIIKLLRRLFRKDYSEE